MGHSFLFAASWVILATIINPISAKHSLRATGNQAEEPVVAETGQNVVKTLEESGLTDEKVSEVHQPTAASAQPVFDFLKHPEHIVALDISDSREQQSCIKKTFVSGDTVRSIFIANPEYAFNPLKDGKDELWAESGSYIKFASMTERENLAHVYVVVTDANAEVYIKIFTKNKNGKWIDLTKDGVEPANLIKLDISSLKHHPHVTIYNVKIDNDDYYEYYPEDGYGFNPIKNGFETIFDENDYYAKLVWATKLDSGIFIDSVALGKLSHPKVKLVKKEDMHQEL